MQSIFDAIIRLDIYHTTILQVDYQLFILGILMYRLALFPFVFILEYVPVITNSSAATCIMKFPSNLGC